MLYDKGYGPNVIVYNVTVKSRVSILCKVNTCRTELQASGKHRSRSANHFGVKVLVTLLAQCSNGNQQTPSLVRCTT